MNIIAIIALCLVGLIILRCAQLYLCACCRQRSRPFNSKSTGEEVLFGVNLSGKCAIVTGSNSGLGKLTAQLLLGKGCTVIMANRNQAKSEAARTDILESFPGDEQDDVSQRMILMKLDLSSLESVRAFAEEFVSRKLECHYLINNAGIMALPEYRTTKDGIEQQFGVCHIGHFYLTCLLLQPVLIPNKARVITVTSFAYCCTTYNAFNELMDVGLTEKTFMGSRKGDYMPWKAYGNAKSANLLFARHLDTLYGKDGIISVCCHPGTINTDLGRDMSTRMSIRNLCIMLRAQCCTAFAIEEMKSLEQGVSCTLRCVAMSDKEIKGGEYYHNCVDSTVHGNVTQAAVIRGGDDILAQKLWELSELIITNAGFELELSPV